MPTTADDRITGWLLDEQAEWLAEQARSRHRILELGAWKGLSTKALVAATPGKVWVVDRWGSDDPEDDATYEFARESRAGVLNAFLENMRPWASKLAVLNMDSSEAFRRCGHLGFDMVWLDGDHRYEPTKRAIREWGSLLVRGGLLCGHDGEHPQVRRAVEEMVPGVEFHATKQRQPFGPALIWYSDGYLE